jgi:hypothetical protein
VWFWFGRFTYYRRGEREQQENKVRAAGGRGNRSYSTVQNSDRREDGRGREGAMPSQRERERAVKDKTEQSVLQQRKRERREEGERERSRAGPQMPSLVVDDVS